MIKKVIFFYLALITITTPLFSQTIESNEREPITISFQGRLYSPVIGLLNNSVTNEKIPAEIGIYSGKKSTAIWKESHPNIQFNRGNFNVTIGKIDNKRNPLFKEHLSITSPNLGVKIFNNFFYFPLTSIPFAITAKHAEEGLYAEAESINGAFIRPFIAKTDFIINNKPSGVDKSMIFKVDSKSNKVAVYIHKLQKLSILLPD